ncbi:hypothetical protein KUTeg_006460 [Tegillarca granosa]|uniref:VASt domain-containing protein n=1 Tax=Tegillarca granosa TaxID=220873 RepID=A0ABQ9FGJ7_TEGGR|nr:hypothetical protein KUTeg_006460 [Tegillarca granosa]
MERLTLDEFYHISIDMMFELLFTDSLTFRTFLGSRKISDWSATPWQEDEKTATNRSRTVTYVLALNYSIGPKSSQTVERQICLKQSPSGSYYVIDVECTCPGIPYGDTFMVVNRYCLSKVSKSKCRLKVSSEVRYKKSVWGLVKTMIEKNSYQGVIDYFKALDIFLRREEKQESLKSQHSKKKLRKRRTRTGQNVIENPKLKPTRHLSLMESKTKQGRQPIIIQPSPSHNLIAQREELSQLNADSLVRVILVV